MDIPRTVQEMELYCDSVFSLLEIWNWVYHDRATEILLSGVLKSEYLNILEELDYNTLNQLPLGLTKESWPPELVHYIKECEKLSFNIPSAQIEHLEIPDKLKKCTSLKKEHEINRLTKYILNHCHHHELTNVFDIGSGLGYIDRLLAVYGDLKVVGIEADEVKIVKAVKLNAELLQPEYYSNIDYIKCKVEDETLKDICEQLKRVKDNSCIIGLHACGDLSTSTLRLFMKINNIRSLILMPCCYHKLKNENNFPVSNTMKYKLTDKRKLINATFLRLASESTKDRWITQTAEEHNAHGFFVLARAIIELFLIEYNYKAKRKGRRCVTKEHNQQWVDYIKIWLERHIVTNKDGVEVTKVSLISNLEMYWAKYCNLLNRVEAYTCLQVCLQGVAESLILIDRLLFLLETRCITASAIRMTNPTISPRSVAIIANKII